MGYPTHVQTSNGLIAIPYAQLNHADYVVFDTETTGLDTTAEVCEITIVDGKTHEVLLDTLVKPTKPIPEAVTDIHGIHQEMVKDAPPFSDLIPVINTLFENKLVVAYNASFDVRLLSQSTELDPAGDWPQFREHIYYCAMLEYARYRKVFDFFRKDFKNFKLQDAAKLEEIDIDITSLHRSRADALLTSLLIWQVKNNFNREYGLEG